MKHSGKWRGETAGKATNERTGTSLVFLRRWRGRKEKGGGECDGKKKWSGTNYGSGTKHIRAYLLLTGNYLFAPCH